MSDKVVTFLQHVGRDFKNGLRYIDPLVKKGIVLAEIAAPEVALLDPALGPIFMTVVATVASVEQKFTAVGKQDGTGVQKAAEVSTILQPIISHTFAQAGKPSDADTVNKYINSIVAFLNAVPVAVSAAAPAGSLDQAVAAAASSGHDLSGPAPIAATPPQA
jgi:hypothetical protein